MCSGYAWSCWRPRSRVRCRNNAGLDFHLLRLAVKLVEKVVDGRNDRRNIADDNLVRPVIGKDIAACAEEFLQRVLHGCGLGIAQNAGHSHGSNRLRLRLLEISLRFRFTLQSGAGGDAQYVSVELLVKAVVLEND